MAILDVNKMFNATAHTAHVSVKRARQATAERVISRVVDIPWPSRSPGLAILDLISLRIPSTTCLH